MGEMNLYDTSCLKKRGVYWWSNRFAQVWTLSGNRDGGIPERYMEQLLSGQIVDVYVGGCLKSLKRDLRAAGLECNIERTGGKIRNVQIRVAPQDRSEEDKMNLSKQGWRA